MSDDNTKKEREGGSELASNTQPSDSIKSTMETLAQLREAGFARGATPLIPPHSGGRYSSFGRPTRASRFKFRKVT